METDRGGGGEVRHDGTEQKIGEASGGGRGDTRICAGEMARLVDRSETTIDRLVMAAFLTLPLPRIFSILPPPIYMVARVQTICNILGVALTPKMHRFEHLETFSSYNKIRWIHCNQRLRKIHAFCVSGNTLGVPKTAFLAAGCKIPISSQNDSFSAV